MLCKSRCFAAALSRLLLSLWVGVLVTSGLLAAPVLFRVLPDRSLAGTVAGELFAMTAWIGIGCALVLLVIEWRSVRSLRWRGASLLWMLLLTLAGHFVLTPMIADLRSAGLTETARFGQLHGLAGVLYLLTLLPGLVLILAGPPGQGQSSCGR